MKEKNESATIPPKDVATAEAAKPAEAPKPETTPDPVVSAAAWGEIQSARRKEREAEAYVLETSEEAKHAKKLHDTASVHLGQLLDDALSGQEQLPFDQPKASPAAAPEAWRSVAIAGMENTLSPAKLKLLADRTPPIVTLGDMADHQKKHGDFWIKEIKGFGPEAAKKYEQICDVYWKANPLPQETAPAAAKAEDAKPDGAASDAVMAARATLGDTIDKRIGTHPVGDIVAIRFRFIEYLSGQADAKAAISGASLRALKSWTERVVTMSDVQVQRIVEPAKEPATQAAAAVA